MPHLISGLRHQPAYREALVLPASDEVMCLNGLSSLDRRASARQTTVLHVVEAFAGGVRTALLQYIESTPDLRHIVLESSRGENVGDTDGHYLKIEMVSGHVRRVLQLRHIAKLVGPDVIHAHSSLAGVYARVLKLAAPVVYTPHCFAFERRDLGPFRRRLFLGIEKILAKRTEILAACSNREKSLANAIGYLDVEVIPNVGRYSNEIESCGRARTTMTREAFPLKVVFAGRLSPQKDPEYAVEVVRELRKGRDREVVVKWLGGGDERFAKKLRSAGLSVTGWLEGKELQAELLSCDVYVHCAQWEGFPMAILEAIQLKTPVVARRIPALQDMPRDFLCDSPASVAHIISAVLHSEDEKMRCVKEWTSALNENNGMHQRLALKKAYRTAVAKYEKVLSI